MSELLHQVDKVNDTAEQMNSMPVLTPAVDIYENEKELVLVADLPGVKQDDLGIKLDNNLLTIEGISKEQKNDGASLLLGEYQGGRYFRQFTLGQSIDRAGIEAKLKGGELVLTLPKATAAQPQRITVTSA